MITTATIGFPRIGPKRNMKSALESFWNGKSTSDELLSVAREVELSAWCEQADAGIEKIALDGTLYDHVLDFASMFGLIPDRFVGLTGLERYFACARGANKIEALDMSKYFDTNYHYLTPEMPSNWTPADSSFEDLLARVRRGIAAVGAARAVPLLLGPLTLASLTKGVDDIVLFVKSLTGAYGRLLDNLRDLGVSEVQVGYLILHEICISVSLFARVFVKWCRYAQLFNLVARQLSCNLREKLVADGSLARVGRLVWYPWLIGKALLFYKETIEVRILEGYFIHAFIFVTKSEAIQQQGLTPFSLSRFP